MIRMFYIYLTLVLVTSSQIFASRELDIKPQEIDADKAELADVVIRADIKSSGSGSKYLWVKVLNLSTYKVPNDVRLSAAFKVAHLSFGQGLPPGEATLYLKYYNADDPSLGWKLIEQYNKKSKTYSKGYSHHSKADQSDVEIDVDGGTIFGTLTKAVNPKSLKKRAVIFVSGSGPTDRDGNTAGAFGKNNCLKYLSNSIVQNGVTTLRVDKRGIAASQKSLKNETDLRFSTYVDDITHCIEYLNRLGYTEIVLLGHSEGALIATIVAKHRSVISVISIAGASLPASKILRKQFKKNLQVKDYELADKIIVELENGKLVKNVPSHLLIYFRPSVQPYLISWFGIDPVDEYKKLNIPSLILQGSTDLQLSVDDAKRLHASGRKSKLVIIEGMNHVLKQAKGNLQQQLVSYINPKLPVDFKLISAVIEFVKQ